MSKQDLKTILLNNYTAFAEYVDNQSKVELDSVLLLHPILGKLTTVREMLFFTIYRKELHLEILKKGTA